MAIHTQLSDISENPAILFEMASKTRRCQMGLAQHKIALLMPFDAKTAGRKSAGGVAIVTIRLLIRPCKISFMIILMAIHAAAVIQRNGVV